MSTPLLSGSSSIANRWLSGSATVLWLGDSIGASLENRLLQVLRVTPAGIGFRGGNSSSIGAPAWAAAGGGGLGAAGLLAETNYSPFPTREVVFNGAAVPVTGVPIGINSRIASDTTEPLLLGTRGGVTFSGLDWLAGTTPKLRCILYRNNNSANGIVRNYLRGSNSNSIELGAGAFLNLLSGAPAWLADDIPFTPPAGAEDLYVEAQSFEGATPVNNTNFVLCGGVISSGKGGFTFIPASNGGWSVQTWLDTTKISDAALAAVLPLLGVTDVVISIGQNNPGVQTALQFQASLQQLAGRFRTALPNCAITFLPTHDTNNAGSAPHLAGFADAHYAAQQLTSNSCFLNLYKAAGPFAQLNVLGLLADGVHPTEAGKVYILQTIQSLLDALVGGVGLPAASGRYATQLDLESLFGRTTIAGWSQFDGSAVADVARIQRALDCADAAIDDFFRDGPYSIPLAATASKATITNWAATLAGAWLYRSRSAGGGGASGSTSPGGTASASLTFSAPFAFAFGSSTGAGAFDPVGALLADVQTQMQRARTAALRLDATPALPTSATAPIVVT
jgi:hypothetical protein